MLLCTTQALVSPPSQDGAANPNDIAALRSFANRARLPIDIAAYPAVNRYPAEQIAALAVDDTYHGGFRVAGAKLSLDGSPQGRTAWMTQPYHEGPAGSASDYVAYPTIDPDTYIQAATTLIGNNVPILVHANGDAAIDLMLSGVETALTAHGDKDHRSVAIHAQLMRADQLDKASTLGIIPSYFSAHPYFWGDWHRKSFGDERAQNISPVRWTVERNVPFTIHNDSPIVPPDMMRLLWSTVNRETRSGFVLGKEQRATVTEALHAITLGAAYQYFEDEHKGSITPGKQADLVILDRNPLKTRSQDLSSTRVIQTIARGETIYDAQCTRLDESDIQTLFSDVTDEATVLDTKNGQAQNTWLANGRFESVWSSANGSGTVTGSWYVKNHRRCVTPESGLPNDDLGKSICSPLFQCGRTIKSINPDGTVHGVHRLSPISPASLDSINE